MSMPDAVLKYMLAFLLSSFFSAFLLVWCSSGLLLLTLPMLSYVRKKFMFPQTLNFKGENIPTGYGLTFISLYVFWFNLLIIFFLFRVISFPDMVIRLFRDSSWLAVYLFVFTVTLVGYYDDKHGQKNIKGLYKNFKVFLSTHRLTSSLIKAGVVFLCSGTFSVFYASELKTSFTPVYDHVVNVFLICLSSNLFNLLDVRPGRTIKIFMLLSWGVILYIFVLGFISRINPFDSYLIQLPVGIIIPVASAVLAYAPLDFRGQAMMGDAGSNMLGFVLGIGYAVILPLPAKIAVVSLLTLFHLYCEFYSFSDFISRNKVLRWLDEWGTCMRKDREQENRAGSDPD